MECHVLQLLLRDDGFDPLLPEPAVVRGERLPLRVGPVDDAIEVPRTEELERDFQAPRAWGRLSSGVVVDLAGRMVLQAKA